MAVFLTQAAENLVLLGTSLITQGKGFKTGCKLVELVTLFGMHLVEFVFKHLNLAADGLLAHGLLVLIFLHLHGLGRGAGHLDEAIDDLLNAFHATALVAVA